jgi:hypothetical protein
MEKHYAWMVSQLQINPTNKLTFHKYRDREHLTLLTGRTTNGFAELDSWSFHSINFPESHENVHTVFIREIGHPPALFNEGIAVALAPQYLYGNGVFVAEATWGGQALHEIAWNLKKEGKIPLLKDLLESSGFFNFNTGETYPMAGSFCQFLLARFGIDHFKSFVKEVTFNSRAEDTQQAFFDTYGVELEVVWQDWIESLN